MAVRTPDDTLVTSRPVARGASRRTIAADRLRSSAKRLRRPKEPAAPGFGSAPGHIRLLGLVLVLVVVAITLFGVSEWRTKRQLMSALVAATQTEDELAWDPPTALAENCLALWLSAGAGAGEATALTSNCGTDVGASGLNTQTAGAIQAASVSAYGAPLTTVEHTVPVTNDKGQTIAQRPIYYSVLVMAQLREWREPRPVKGDETAGDKSAGESQPSTGTWVDRGTAHYRVPIYVNPENGHASMPYVPRQVAPPLEKDAPPLAADLSGADMTDPRTSTLAEYLHRYYVAPDPKNPTESSVANYLVPGVSQLVVQSPNIDQVTILRTAYGEIAGTDDVTALVEMSVRYIGGHSTVQVIPITLSQVGGTTWLVKGIPGSAPLASPTS